MHLNDRHTMLNLCLKEEYPFSMPVRSSGAMNAGEPTKVLRRSSFAKPSAQLKCLSSFAATPRSLSLTLPSLPTRILLACSHETCQDAEHPPHKGLGLAAKASTAFSGQ